MPTPFSRTLRALQADRFGGSGLLLAGGAAVLLAWGGWLFAGRVTVFAVAESARLEVDRAAHALEAPASGRITAVYVALEQDVEAGTVLFELEAEGERLRLSEAVAHREALVAQRSALQQQQSAGGRALDEAGQAGSASLGEAGARYEEAAAAAGLAASELERRKTLYESQVISRAEYERAVAEAGQKQAAAEALRQGLRRIELSLQQQRSDRRADLDALARDLARVEGEIATTGAAIARLEHEIERRRVTAPVAGRVGELAELRVGAFVSAGDRLGSVVPGGGLRAVARFHPATALGRIAPGQPARLRLDGFPSTQYGSVGAVVSRVAGEVQDGFIRVELEVSPDAAARIPLQHGLPGSVEVEVERLAPAALVLRHTGKLVQAR